MESSKLFVFNDIIIITKKVSKEFLQLLGVDEKAVIYDDIHDITVISLFKNRYLKGDLENE